MDEYVCLTVLSRSGESEADFSARLSQFWTHMLRNRLADFEQVYAEMAKFERHGERSGRKYLATEGVVSVLEAEMAAAGIDHQPIDREDLYSRYEAVAPEWMQIEH